MPPNPAKRPGQQAAVGCAGSGIEVAGLSKRYGGHTAVDNVSFGVRPGSVTGFLGPNGAGKSTTMRMLAGLTPPSAGRATVLGVPYTRLPNPGRHVGVLLDASAQHAGRTGREILRLGTIVMGLDARRVDAMLELVGLTAAEAGRRAGTYSLGMRQRLGVAHALLGDPQVLILDEPANGLDPGGIRWMRGLLREFADNGGTVKHSAPWIDLNSAQTPLYNHDMTGQGGAQLLVAAAIWVGIPLVLGTIRVRRGEIKSS
jgi:ABC-2 type transport system ATP-binding protein